MEYIHQLLVSQNARRIARATDRHPDGLAYWLAELNRRERTRRERDARRDVRNELGQGGWL